MESIDLTRHMSEKFPHIIAEGSGDFAQLMCNIDRKPCLSVGESEDEFYFNGKGQINEIRTAHHDGGCQGCYRNRKN